MTDKPDSKAVLLCQDGKPHDWHSGMNASVDCGECGLHLTRHKFILRHDLLENALAVSVAQVEALKRWALTPSADGPGKCYDHAGRLTEFGLGYNAGYARRVAENEVALAAVGKEQP